MIAKNWAKFSNRYAEFYHWLSTTNLGIFFIAAFFLLFNQAVEFFILSDLGYNYQDLCWWDCLRYRSIVENGYNPILDLEPKLQNLNLVFFPVLPLLAKLFNSLINLGTTMSLILVSKIFFLLTIFTFVKFCQTYSNKISPWIASFVITFSPYQIYANTGYTEVIFLFLTCLAFIFLKQNRYIASGIAAAFLSATRPSGIFFLSSYLARFKEFLKSTTEKKIEIILGFLLVPLGLASFMFFLYLKTGDALASSHVQDLVWHRVLQHNPFQVISNGLSNYSTQSLEASLPLVYLAATSLIALIISLILLRQKRYELAFFSLSSTLFYLSFGLLSMPRFVWWQAPIVLVIAEISSHKKLQFFILPIFFLSSALVEIFWINKEAFLV